MPKVKICGNTNPEDAHLAFDLGADFLGLIFAESKRKLNIKKAAEIMKALPQYQNFVGVFSGQPKAYVLRTIRELNLKWVQFHGNETSPYCDSFSKLGIQVIKTFRIKDRMSLKRLDEYNVSAFLFDTYSRKGRGGTGDVFDWKLIEDKPYVHEKLFLAGGLTVDNLTRAIEQIQPFAVDVASGVEKEPGVKDPELLKEFIAIAKKIKVYKS